MTFLESRAACEGELPITKDTTLNAAVKRYPELLHLLNMFRLDDPWFGSETLEWAAWHRGMHVDEVVDELNRAITQKE